MLRIPTARGRRATKGSLATNGILRSDSIMFKDNIAVVFKFFHSNVVVLIMRIKKMT